MRVGNALVTVYRVPYPRAKGGFQFVLAWRGPDGRKRRTISNEADALAEARLKAEQLDMGRTEGAEMSRADRDELAAARHAVGDVPLLAAVKEWAKARELCKGSIIAAAESWASRNATEIVPITVRKAIDTMIAETEKAGHAGERTYRAKLDPLAAHFGEKAYLHVITTGQLNAYLHQWSDPVTRNDIRKRAVTLWRWARDAGHLPEGAPLAIERTKRSKERANPIGIIGASAFAELLTWTRANYPEKLAAVVLAGFCFIRVDEIHGKRENRDRCQVWEDVFLDRGYVRVSAAKENTPAWRHVPLCPAAIEWLKLTPKDERKGRVCAPAALEILRVMAKRAGLKLPKNALRHSGISYRIEVTQNKPQVALEAGNSVKEIDRRYRVPVERAEAEAWFAVLPG